MSSTILLDVTTWDLVLDADDNIAAAAEPYSLSQDAASAIKTFLGEVFWDTQIGVPWLQRILGKNPPLALVKEIFVAAALTVPGVVSAKVFLTAATDRVLAGQVQTVGTAGVPSASAFSVINPQGVG